MKILFAILAILFATVGRAKHMLFEDYQTRTITKIIIPFGFLMRARILIFCCVFIVYLLSFISFGLAWYWSLLITIPTAFCLPAITLLFIWYQYPEQDFMPAIIRLVLGLVFSIIAICI